MEEITGIFKGVTEVTRNKNDGSGTFTIYTIEVSNALKTLKLQTFSGLMAEGYSVGDEVIAEYEVKQSGMFTNYNISRLQPRDKEEKSRAVVEEYKKKIDEEQEKTAEELKADADGYQKKWEAKKEAMSDERVRSIAESINNILVIGGKKYEVTFTEIIE